MHSQLGIPDRQLACGELIAALEACHAQGMLYKWSGACNDQKWKLSLCLTQERVERTTKNREASKERNAKKYAAWAALKDDVEGPTTAAATTGEKQ